MNILLVTQNYLPFIGGVETHARQVAHELAQGGHCVTIAAGNFAPTRLSRHTSVLHASLLAPTHQDYADGDVPVRALTPRGTDRLRMLPIAIRVLPRLRRYAYHQLHRAGYSSYRAVYLPRLRRLVEEADVVHSLAHDYLGWTTQAAAQQRGIPFVVTPFVHPQQWGDGPNDVAFYRRAAAVIGLVDTDSGYLESLGVARERLHTIGVSPDLPPTVDPAGFRERHGLGEAPVVLYVGRMMAQKGASAVVAAASRVWEKHPDARFLFIGPGREDEVAVFRGADARLRYLGKVSVQEKADALAACDIFCMPSMSEILPIVYLEAWSYGKPVVGGRAHGLPELVEGNGAGLAVSQDPGDVADALSCLLDDPARRERFGQTGKALVERRYTVAAVTGQLEALYQTLVTARPTPAQEGVAGG
jgi:glycosyltransferase involved in cell wall biosynthesis